MTIMMKKNILKGLLCLTLAIASLPFSSCKDDGYPPITLTSVSSETPSLEENVLEIPLFSEGVSFYITGGNGSYIIEAPDTDKIDYRYDGNQLTILPKALGTASLTISDRAGNHTTLQVNVSYPETTYEVSEVSGIARGGGLTQDQTLEIQNDIEANSPVQAGGKYVFTYTNESHTEGMVTLYADGTGANERHGIFTQTAQDNGDLRIHIELTGGTEYDLTLSDSSDTGTESGTAPGRFMRQDVTGTYRASYPELEEAYCLQYIPGETL